MATKQTSTSNMYRQYQRQPRVQYPEEQFNLGMSYTNTPLKVGFSKMLVNFDLKESGEALTPRSGLRVTELGCFGPNELPYSYDAKRCISEGRDCVESDNKKYKQIIIGLAEDEKPAGSSLYNGTAILLTIDEGSEDLKYFDDVVAKTMYKEAIGSSIQDPIHFRRPEHASIHGMELTNLGYIAKHVGKFAFNNSYYYFGKPQELHKTKLKDGRYQTELVPIKEISPKEAVLWGYNMLKSNPYAFTDSAGSGQIQLLGLLPYDKAGQVIMSPQVNQTLNLRCYYTADPAVKYQIYWDWKEPGGSTWTTFKKQELVVTGIPKLEAEFSSPSKSIMVRVSAYKWNGTAYETVTEKVLTVGFNFDKAAYGSTANIEVKTYDLSTASGIGYWKNRLLLYGLAQDPTILFFSEVNEPGYFPYPNNVDIFDEPIIYVTPFLDNLLVFTATKLHMLTLGIDGLTWTKKTIQGNLDIKEWDLHLIQIVKNMVFFKSGNYFYMVVPRAGSLTGELTIAPVSKFIEALLDDFKPVVTEMATLLYDYKGPLDLVHYYNFLDFEDVHNMYVFQTDKGVYLNVDLLYNTLLRVWRIHIYESQNILHPYKQDATKKGQLMSLVNIIQRFKLNGTVSESSVFGLQFFQFDNGIVKDRYIPAQLKVLAAFTDPPLPAAVESVDDKLALIHVFKNYQLLDAGYREHSTDFNKRYREVQLKFNNISQKTLQFLTEFSIDGDMRKSFYTYEMHQETDPTDPNYGLIYLERIPIIPEILPGSTVLAGDEHYDPDSVYTVLRDTNQNSPTYGIIKVTGDKLPEANLGAWTLDNSLFPETVLWKVRIPVSGKGYAPKLRLLSFNEERFELLNLIWVLRMMNSR